jgi:hypothetical protein
VIPRVTFFFITVFWVAMNVLLWRLEYGADSGEVPVPADLVWKKILTAPDISSLTVYQNGQRMGFCEFSTSVEQAMSRLDENAPLPEGLAARAGYQIRLDGNVGLDSLTNRVRFDGRLQFSSARDLENLDLKISAREIAVSLYLLATNQTVHLKITGADDTIERDFTFAELQNPNALLRAFAGNADVGFLDGFELPQAAALAKNIHWHSRRERLMMGREPVSVYQLETEVLGNRIVIDVSPIGEILRVELPGGFTATPDEWNKP